MAVSQALAWPSEYSVSLSKLETDVGVDGAVGLSQRTAQATGPIVHKRFIARPTAIH